MTCVLEWITMSLIGLATLCVVTGLLAYYLYVPLPRSIEDRVKTSILLAPLKVVDDFARFTDLVGFCKYEHVKKRLSDTLNEMITARNKSESSLKVTDTHIDGVPVRLYEPVRSDSTASRGFIYIHGGGWIFGSPAGCHKFTHPLAKKTNMVLISIHYRLAPEHVYPAALDDCVTVAKYVLKNAAEFHVNPNRVAIGGDSAGGNLAVAVALKLRDINFSPKLKIQVPIYPALQFLDFQTDSYLKYGHIPILTKESMIKMVLSYVSGNTNDYYYLFNNTHISVDMKARLSMNINQSQPPEKYRLKPKVSMDKYVNSDITQTYEKAMSDPYLCPLMADNFSDLPQTYLITAEYDILRDDGWLYAERLRRADNDVTHRQYKSVHAFTYFTEPPAQLRPAVECLDDLCAYLKRYL